MIRSLLTSTILLQRNNIESYKNILTKLNQTLCMSKSHSAFRSCLKLKIKASESFLVAEEDHLRTKKISKIYSKSYKIALLHVPERQNPPTN